MARMRTGRDGPLTPADIATPDMARDPGVTARPVAVQVGNPRDPRGEAMAAEALALRSFSRDMMSISASFEALAEKRQAAEDAIAVDRGQLLLNQRFEPLIQQSLTGPGTGSKTYLRDLDGALAAEQEKVFQEMKEGGYALSPDGQRKFEHAAMQLRIGAARRAAVTANNQRVAQIQLRADDNINDIARLAGATGDIDGAMARVDGTLNTLSTVLAPQVIGAYGDKARKMVLDAAVDGYIRRGRIDKAQALVDRYTGFAKQEAGEVPKAIVTAAQERGVDPAVALAISHVETGGKFDPQAKNPTSTASGLGQFTADTARRLGLPEDASTADVPAQARGLAALTADNIAALRRGLNAEPNPTDIYLAHFLGAPTAVRALKSDPAAKVADVLSDGQIKANANIRFNGKALPDWTVGDLYAWSRSKMGEALAASNSLIEGRTVSEKDAIVPIKDVMQLGHTVHNAATAERSRLRVLMNDDIASIRATGHQVNIDQVAAAHILPQGEFQTWKEAREGAKAYYDATKDMGTVPDTEIRRRIESFRPVPGDAGFARQQKLFNEVSKIGEEHIESRVSDPAGSVSESPLVKEAMKGFNARDPKTWKPLIDARLAAQDQVGIPEDRRSPITKDEASALAEPLRMAMPGQERQVLAEIATTTKEQFGEHADKAFEFVLRANRVRKETALIATRIAKKLGLGQKPTREDAADLDNATEIDAADAVMGTRPTPPAAETPPGGVSRGGYLDRAMSQREAATPGTGSPTAIRGYEPYQPPGYEPEPGVNVPARAVKALREDPSRAADFDKKYGAGTAKKILDKYRTR
jgi:hypothetical protein